MKLIDNRILAILGEHCFEIYLVHVTLFGILPLFMQSGIYQFAVMSLLTIILSYLLHKYLTLRMIPKIVNKCEKIKPQIVYFIVLIQFIIFVSRFLSEFEVIKVSDKGQYKTIQEAVDIVDANKHSIIIVFPGTYAECICLNDLDVAIIGLNKEKTVISNNSGKYSNAPITAYGDFKLYNLSVEMTLDSSGGWIPTYERWPADYPGYALHIEGDNSDPKIKTKAIIKNGDFYSESNCAVGLGMHNNQSIYFENCHFKRICYDNSFKYDNCRGAFVAHCSNCATDQNQLLSLRNCAFYSNYGYAGNIMGTLEGGKGMSILAENNSFFSNEMGEDCFLYDKGETVLLPDSSNNTAECLNYN